MRTVISVILHPGTEAAGVGIRDRVWTHAAAAVSMFDVSDKNISQNQKYLETGFGHMLLLPC